MSDKSQVEMLQRSVEEWNVWRHYNPTIIPDLTRAILVNADLSYARLDHANLSRADLVGANLTRANLTHADLRRADLYHAKLVGADMHGAKVLDTTYGQGVSINKLPIQVLGLRWDVIIFDDHMKIGCELHSFDEWRRFTNEEISSMSPGKSLDFWKKHKTALLAICDTR